MQQFNKAFSIALAIVIVRVSIPFAVDISGNNDVPHRDDPQIIVDPMMIDDEINIGSSSEYIVEVANRGDELLEFSTELNIVSEPDQVDTEHLRVLIFTEGEGFGGDHVSLEGAIAAGVDEDNILEVRPEDIPDLNLFDWDVIVWSDYHENFFYQQYNWNRGLFEEWLSLGGALVMNVHTTMTNPSLLLPGGVIHLYGGVGLTNTNTREEEVNLDNPLIEGLPNDQNDDLPQVITGAPASQTFFWRDFLVENEDISNLQIFYSQTGNPNYVTFITYEFGGGYICATTQCISGFWYQPEVQEGEWMEDGPRWLSRSQFLWAAWVDRDSWISVDQLGEMIELEPDRLTNLTVQVDGSGLVTGVYTAELHILSNDNENPDIAVSIEIEVADTPDIEIRWYPHCGYPVNIDWCLAFEQLFPDQEYVIPVTIRNRGTANLAIEEIEIDGAGSEWFSVEPEGNFNPIPGGGQLQVMLTLSSEETGRFEPSMIIRSNDPDEEEVEIPLDAIIINAPVIVIDPQAIEDIEIIGAERVQRIINVANDGEGLLTFRIEKEIVAEPQPELLDDNRIPYRDFPGEVLFEFDMENDEVDNPDDLVITLITNALAWDSEHEWMWSVNTLSGVMIAVDPNNDFQTARRWGVNILRPWDIAWHDGIIYAMHSYNEYLELLDINGNIVNRLHLDLGGWMIGGVAVDNKRDLLFVISFHQNENALLLHVFSMDGEQVAVVGNLLPLILYESTASIEWVPSHQDGYLWIHTPENLWQIQVDTDNWEFGEVTQRIRTFGMHAADGFAHDGDNMWITATESGDCRIIDDGVREAHWLTVEPMGGEIPGENGSEITVTIDGTRQPPGEYRANLIFLSNDPNNPEVVVPIRVIIHAAPQIGVHWSTEAGFNIDDDPPVVDWNVKYEDLFVGERYDVPVTVKNYGQEELRVTDIQSNLPYFSAEPTEFTLDYLEDIEVVFSLESDQEDEFDAVMVIESNDPNHEDMEIPLHAVVSDPPIIVVEPDEIFHELVSGESSDAVVNISNDGGADLRWKSKVEILDDEIGRFGLENPPANPSRTLRSTDPTSMTASGFTNRNTNQDKQIPHRDQPEGRFLLYQDAMGYGWVFQNVFQQIIGIDYVWIDNSADLRDVDLYDFDIIWIETGSQSENFRNFWNNNVMRFEEWIAEGNSMYLEQGYLDFEEEVIVAPGGLEYIADPQQGILAVGPEDNWLVEQMDWEEGQLFLCHRGIPFTKVAYPVEALENIWNSDGYQVICKGITHQNPTVVEYNYGAGTVIVSGSFTGSQWQAFNGEGQWGSCSEILLEYLAMLSDVPWVTCVPSQGVLPSNFDNDLILTLNSTGLVQGEHRALLHFLSNDPIRSDVTISIGVQVEGFPVAEVIWSDDCGFPDIINYNMAYEELFADGAYPVPVTIANIGADVMHIEDISINDENFFTDWNEEQQDIIEAGQEIEVNFFLSSDEARVCAGVFTIIFGDEELEPVEVSAWGETSEGPLLVVNPDAIDENLATGESCDVDLSLSNAGEVQLIWRTEAEILDQPDGLFQNGPVRDDAGDIIDEFEIPNIPENVYKPGIAWDSENEWMWINTTGVLGDPGIIRAFDPLDDYALVQSFNAAIQISDMTCLNGQLYVVDRVAQVLQRYDREGHNLGQIQMDGWNPGAVTSSRELGLFFVMEEWPNFQTRPIHVLEAEENGDIGEEIGLIEGIAQQIADVDLRNNQSKTLLWVDEHPNGQLWLASGLFNDGNLAWQFSVDTEEWEAEYVQHFYTFGDVQLATEYGGLGHDGENLWASNCFSTSIRIIDDGINEKGWLSWEPHSGDINPNEDGLIVVTLNATGLIAGEYTAELYIFSNDPRELENPDITIPVTLTVDANPDIEVIPGGEEQEPVLFDVAYFDYPVAVQVTVRNIGMADLEIIEVLRDEQCPDFYVLENDLEDFIVGVQDEAMLDVWYEPNRNRADAQQATLTFVTNDMNWEDGYPVQCESQGALDAPVLIIDPHEIQAAMNVDSEEEFPINAENRGGSPIRFDTDIEVISVPGQDLVCGSRRTLRGTDKTKSHRPVERSPRRDQPEGRGLLVQNNCRYYGWEFEQYFEAIEGLEYDHFRDWNQLADVDLTEYDFIWIGNYETDAWVENYNDELERIEAFVDGGGAIYHSSGASLVEVRPVNPGGLVYFGGNQQSQTECPIVLNPEDNYFINYMNENDPTGWDWRAEQILQGFRQNTPVAFGYFRLEEIEQIDNCDWYQVMVMGNPSEQPIALTYQYGDGFCFVTTILDGYHHYWPENAQWGRTGEAVIWYLDHMTAQVDTFHVAPSRGVIESDAELELVLTINTENLISGDYEAALHITSNDPENPDQIVTVSLRVSGDAAISGDPLPYPFEEAVDMALEGDFYLESEYEFPIVISNIGGEPLEISEVQVSEPDNWNFDLPEEGRVIEAHQSVEGVVNFHPVEVGEHRVEIHLSTNAANVENGEVWWVILGAAVLPPEIGIELPGQADSLYVEMDVDQPPVQRSFIISNVEAEIRGNLRFKLAAEFDEDEHIRSVSGDVSRWYSKAGPKRDEAGEVLAEFNVPISYTSGMAFDGELMWGCGYEQGMLIAVSVSDLDVVLDFGIHQHPNGIAFDGDNLWIGSYGSNRIYIYNLQGELVEGLQIDLQRITGIASDQERFMYFLGESRVHVYNIDDREEVAIINQLPGFEHNAHVYGIQWIPEHLGGQLWGTGNNVVYQAFVDENRTTYPIQHFEVETGWMYAGSSHDGEYLWVGSAGNEWRIVDDGVIEYLPGWLQVDPQRGEIVSGESMDVNLTFLPDFLDADSLYSANLLINSNDPDRASVVVGIYLQTGEVSVEPNIVIPAQYYISQGYPNPFNSVVRFDFGLPKPVDVNITVYDISGRVVDVLVKKRMDAGAYSVTWNAVHESTGVYLVHFDNPEFSRVKKLTLIR